jgi:hypothetical protein
MPTIRHALVALLTLGGLPLSALAEDEPLKPVHIPCNSEADEVDPHIASNGLTLYLSVKTADGYELHVTKRQSARQGWPLPKPPEDAVAVDADAGGVFSTVDGRYPMFLYVSRKDREGMAGSLDLYVAVKPLPGADKVFSFPKLIQTLATKEDEAHPWLRVDGKMLYFSRKTNEGWRVFHSSRKEATGALGWEEPVLIEEFAPNFHHATLSPDGRTMYLQGPLEKDRVGLFVSKHTGDGWGKPEPLTRLNSTDAPRGDMAPCLSRDGRLLYFASDRPGGKGGFDIWGVQTADLEE